LKFQDIHNGALPKSKADVEEVVSIAREINNNSGNSSIQLDEDLLKKLTKFSRGQLAPMVSFLFVFKFILIN
jgi:hypothetical protein